MATANIGLAVNLAFNWSTSASCFPPTMLDWTADRVPNKSGPNSMHPIAREVATAAGVPDNLNLSSAQVNTAP